jgi:hypothetical protein
MSLEYKNAKSRPPRLIKRIQNEAPKVRVVIRLAGRDEGLPLIDSGDMDLGICRLACDIRCRRSYSWLHHRMFIL